MSSCKASLGTQHFIIDVADKDAVIESLMNSMQNDRDLIENDEHFQDDTLELGYDSEADRIVKEYIAENGFPSTVEEYKKAYAKISAAISDQDYYGDCALDFIRIDETRLSVMFVYGGHDE